ncbi:MAG: DUF2721 domain-containing protein [Phycisphaeraceae bacterium]
MQEALRVIQLLVAPVVIISANGLVCLALYNRLTAIITRTRTFIKERYDLTAHVAGLSDQQRDHPSARHWRQRSTTLNTQVQRMLRRARLLRNGLLCLLTTILCMLICSLLLGLSILYVNAAVAALVVFFLGIVVMIVGTVLAMVELLAALEPVTLEFATLADAQIPSPEESPL